MAPERYVEAPAATAAGPIGLASALQLGCGPSDGRAALRWPFTSREQQERAQRAAAEAAHSETTPESSDADEGERNNLSGEWENDFEVESESGESSAGSPLRAQARQPADQDEPPEETKPALSQEWVAERHTEMFVEGAAGLAASELVEIVRKVTGQLVKVTWAHVQGLTQDNIGALSKSFGNFDRVVALGWLLGDAMGLPLMERKDAHMVGLRWDSRRNTRRARSRARKHRFQGTQRRSPVAWKLQILSGSRC